jgi:hypothetical protein
MGRVMVIASKPCRTAARSTPAPEAGRSHAGRTAPTPDRRNSKNETPVKASAQTITGPAVTQCVQCRSILWSHWSHCDSIVNGSGQSVRGTFQLVDKENIMFLMICLYIIN